VFQFRRSRHQRLLRRRGGLELWLSVGKYNFKNTYTYLRQLFIKFTVLLNCIKLRVKILSVCCQNDKIKYSYSEVVLYIFVKVNNNKIKTEELFLKVHFIKKVSITLYHNLQLLEKN